MQPLVSVIVPVYKVEDRLLCCLDSLSGQSMPDIDILLIDDASPDRCGEICDEYAAKDDRFRVFHNKSNRGLSAVRNFGIKNAFCDYLMFVDGDDRVHKDFCKEAYECALKYQADMVLFRCHRINNFGRVEDVACRTDFFTRSGYITQTEVIDALHKNSIWQAPWNKLYRKELFDGISFPSGRLYEGTGTIYKTFLRASSIYYLDKVLYYYCYREGSITTLKTVKALHDWFEMSLQQYSDLKLWGYSADKLDVFLKNRALSYCIRKKPDPYDKQYSFCANILLENNSFPDSFTLKRKLLLFLFRQCRPLFELICVLFGKKDC